MSLVYTGTSASKMSKNKLHKLRKSEWLQTKDYKQHIVKIDNILHNSDPGNGAVPDTKSH